MSVDLVALITAELEAADSATGATAFMDNSYYQGYTDALHWVLTVLSSEEGGGAA